MAVTKLPKFRARPEFSEVLERQRLLRGWSERKLADEAGVGNSLVTSYENPDYIAVHELDAGKVIQIAEALNRAGPEYEHVSDSKWLYLAGYIKKDPDAQPPEWPPYIVSFVEFVLSIGDADTRKRAINIAIATIKGFLGTGK